ncbi:MAG: RNA polymerase sigma-70 factor [Bacteroidales bacterium]
MKQTLDKSTFESLFRKEFQGLVIFSMKYVKDHDTAREIVQEAFLALWEKRRDIDLSQAFRTYLSTAVRNRSLNYLRDNHKFNRGILSLEGLYPPEKAMPTDAVLGEELKERIRAAIAELPEKCREAFLLNRNEGLKYKEIAREMGVSVKTVESHLTKALKHLRDRLKDYLVLALIFCKFLSG